KKRLTHDIPLESRIIAVVDTYDAMTTDRCYRVAISHQNTIDELIRCSGTQFDPDCVRVFLRLYQDRPPIFPTFPSIFNELLETPFSPGAGSPSHPSRVQPRSH